MKKLLGLVVVVVALSISCMAWQVNIPITGGGLGSAPKQPKPTSKTLSGDGPNDRRQTKLQDIKSNYEGYCLLVSRRPSQRYRR